MLNDNNAKRDDESSCVYYDPDANVTAQLLKVAFRPADLFEGDEWKMSFYFSNDAKLSGGKAYGLYKIELDAVYENYTLFNDTSLFSSLIMIVFSHLSVLVFRIPFGTLQHVELVQRHYRSQRESLVQMLARRCSVQRQRQGPLRLVPSPGLRQYPHLRR